MRWRATQEDLEKERQSLLRSKANGVVRFVLIQGVLVYGISCFVLVTLYKAFIKHDPGILTPSNLCWELIGWMGAGALYGILMWTWHKGEQFQKSRK